MPKHRRRHPIETFFGKLRKWFAAAQQHDPGMLDAEVARRFAERTPPASRVIGGIDEPGLKPLARGEATYPLIVRTEVGPVVTLHPLFRQSPPAAHRLRQRLRCTSRELLN